MFSFFTKKHFLIDHLNGFVDIHNHILPGIDDGAKTVEDSLELIKGFGEFGVADFICTPHIMENYYPNTPDTIHNSLVLLKNGLKMNDFNHVRIEAAAEHMIDAGFEGLVESNSILPIKKHYLLIEMSYLQPSINFNQAFKRINDLQIFAILAHPERYLYLKNNKKYFSKMKKNGLKLQGNLLSFGGYYGKEVLKASFTLLEREMYDFLGSDVHNLSQLNALKNIKISSKYIGKFDSLISKTINAFY